MATPFSSRDRSPPDATDVPCVTCLHAPRSCLQLIESASGWPYCLHSLRPSRFLSAHRGVSYGGAKDGGVAGDHLGEKAF
jgi:hypothetical protein